MNETIPLTVLAVLAATTLHAAPQPGANSRATTERAQSALPEHPSGFLLKTLTQPGGEQMRYSVFVPPDYTPRQSWPLILFMHGSGERGDDGLLPLTVGLPRAVMRSVERAPAVILIPQCASGDVWWSPRMTRAVLTMLDTTMRDFNIDADRLYVTGLSLGGGGTWHMGAVLRDRVAALAPVCGLSEDRMQSQQSLSKAVANIPVWAFHGDQDRAVPVEETRTMVARVRDAGGAVRYTEYPGGQHNVWDQAYANPEFWEWLLARRRGEPLEQAVPPALNQPPADSDAASETGSKE